MSTMNQFHFKASSCVFETPSGKNYVFPTRFDKFEEDDIDCSVVEQYVPMRGKYISQGGPKIVVDHVWRCRSCLSWGRRCKNLTMKQRYIKGEWLTVSDYMAYRNFPVDFMSRYFFYYRFSHVIIMRDILASSQLPKGLAQKIGYDCKVQTALELKQIVEAVDGLEWDKLTSQLKNNENQPSLDDFQVELLKQCVMNLPIEKLSTWFESADSQLPKGLAQKIGYDCKVHSALELKQIVEAVDGVEWVKLKMGLKNNENQPSLDDFQVELLKQCVMNLPIEKLSTWFESADSQLPKGLAQKIGYDCKVHSALELKQIVEAVDGVEWVKLKMGLKNNENQPSLDDFQVELLKQCVMNLPIEKLRTWFESAEEGDNIYMRMCKHCLDNNKSKPNNKTRKKAPPVAVYKASLRRAMVAKKDEIVCQHMNCGSIIKITDPEQLRSTGIWCKNCYIVRALGQMKFNMEKYEEKVTRERECKNNILVSHIRSILFHFTNYNFHN